MPAAKLTPELTEKFVTLLRAGNTVLICTAVLDVGETTFFTWMERGTRTGKANAPYRDFRDAIEVARAEAESILVTRVSIAAQSSWRAATWLLERRYPERWATAAERRAAAEDPPEVPTAPDELTQVKDDLEQRRQARAAASR